MSSDNRFSFVIGILAEHQNADKSITTEMIRRAVVDLYGDWDIVSESTKSFIERAIENGDYDTMRREIAVEEKETKAAMLEFEEKYPAAITKDNIESILAILKRKTVT